MFPSASDPRPTQQGCRNVPRARGIALRRSEHPLGADQPDRVPLRVAADVDVELLVFRDHPQPVVPRREQRDASLLGDAVRTAVLRRRLRVRTSGLRRRVEESSPPFPDPWRQPPRVVLLVVLSFGRRVWLVAWALGQGRLGSHSGSSAATKETAKEIATITKTRVIDPVSGDAPWPEPRSQHLISSAVERPWHTADPYVPCVRLSLVVRNLTLLSSAPAGCDL